MTISMSSTFLAISVHGDLSAELFGSSTLDSVVRAGVAPSLRQCRRCPDRFSPCPSLQFFAGSDTSS